MAFRSVLSGSTNGKLVSVTGTSAAAAVALHVAGSSSNSLVLDEVWLYATNTAASNISVTLCYGDTSAASLVTFTVPSLDGFYTLVPGFMMNGGKTISAYSATASSISIGGFVVKHDMAQFQPQ